MGDMPKKCEECAFSSASQPGGSCYHPENEKYTCVGFRRDPEKRFLFFRTKEKRCGRVAVYFKPKTRETVMAIKKMERDKEVARFLEEEKRKEVASRIENVLTRRIENALRDAGYDICRCNHVTFDYRNNEGTRVIVNVLLEDFHVTKKEQKIIQQKDKTRSQE
jgi:hypothetical protein